MPKNKLNIYMRHKGIQRKNSRLLNPKNVFLPSRCNKMIIVIIIILITEITEQRLCDQARMIRKNEWITKLELESISRKVLQKEKDIEVNNNDNTGERFYQDEENIHENEATQVDT